MIIIEFLNFQSLLKIFIKQRSLKKTNGKEVNYLYKNGALFYVYKMILTSLGFKCNKLNFKLINIREKNGEINNLKILREDLFEIEKNINDESKNNELFNENITLDEKNYILKSILTESITVQKSYWRLIYLINVINIIFKNKNKILILENRNWQNVITIYANKLNVNVIIINFFSINVKLFIKNTIKQNLKFLYLLRDILNNKRINKKQINNTYNKILCESYSQVNLSNKNYKSDFFWLLNSNFSKKNIYFNCVNKEDALHLKNNDISFSFKKNFNKFVNLKRKNPFSKIKSGNILFNREKKFINKLLKNYDTKKLNLINYYKENNIKVVFDWYRYDPDHIIKHDAINEIGGISCLWQFAFEGQKYYDVKSFADINFSYSKFSSNIHKLIKSKFKQQIITGLPTYELEKDTIDKADQIKKKLMLAGAKKIICILDENSVDDDRWHTGKDYQRDNYKFIINQLLSNNDLGVIFKPKIAYTLRDRLGEYSFLLDEAIKTKRCFIYSDDKKRSTQIPPLVAALSSDLVIHAHLSAGTAAIECAQKNIPTILVNREMAKGSKLAELPTNKIVFESFEDAVDAFNDHLFLNKPIEEFGDWSKYIYEFDPFNDHKGAYRIGTYLKNIIEGYNQSMKKNDILLKTAENYAKKWGKDKVVY